ncbi:HEPN domain-containing protein [Microcoleus sp. ARI1-A1]|uniref:HEPN domain-containing protein n=2 Tax=unclassified Microcoleus TaxID=2642155 RepID=UPI002FD6C1B0
MIILQLSEVLVTQTMQESFSNSAGRHLQDAQILLQSQRWDNAVYLAAYVVECSFKLLVELYFKDDKGAVKKYGHDLQELDGRAMERLRVLYPILDRQLPASRIAGTVLAQDHPERRYAKSQLWTEEEAKLAVQRAEEIYREIIPKLVLNGSISSKDI